MATALIVLKSVPSGNLVLQRRDHNTKVYPGLLTFFGGRVEPDESPSAAAARELHEETSLGRYDASAFKDLGFHQVLLDDGRLIDVYLYLLEITSNDFEVFEGAGREVYSRDEIERRTDLAEFARRLLPFIPY